MWLRKSLITYVCNIMCTLFRSEELKCFIESKQQMIEIYKILRLIKN